MTIWPLRALLALLWPGNGPQGAALPAVVVVNHKSDNHPHKETNPVGDWQAGHQQQASQDREDRRYRTSRSAKCAPSFRLAITQNQNSSRHQSERKKRSDV